MNIFKQLRKENKLTQAELSERLNVTQSTVSKWEQGKTTPDYPVLRNLSEIYKVSIDTMLGGNYLALQQNDLGVITDKQSQLFKMIQKLDNDRFFMVYGYTERLLREMI